MNGTIALVISRQLKCDAHYFFGHVMSLTMVSASYNADSTVHGIITYIR